MNTIIQKSIKLGSRIVPARIVMPPMAVGKAPDGNVSEAVVEYYRQRGENENIGILITEHSYVTQQGKAHDNQFSAALGVDPESFRKLTDTIHSLNNGTLIFQQLSHAGSRGKRICTGMEVVGPSEDVVDGEPVRELTRQEIRTIEDEFADAAKRAEEAGFDGIELHAAHGYLLMQFYSPLSNHRHDEYGCDSIENRVRFHVETLKKIRQVVSEDFLVGLRFGASDDMPDGSGASKEDGVAASLLFEEAGADFIDISAGFAGFRKPTDRTPGFYKEVSGMIRQAVNIPVFTTGGVTCLAEAECIIENGYADFVGIGRGLLKSAELH